ncbi:MAG: TolC family protein [Muribaculaceae bacterium]|nr:TolC family protein [Muribaculaceae bacterium]
MIICLAFFQVENINAQTEILSSTHSVETGKRFSLEQAAMKILLESPGFKADTYSLKSLQAELKTSNNLPDPEVGGEYLVMPEDVENRWAAEISWGIEWPGVYGAKGQEAKSRMISADKAVMAQRIDRLTEIKDLLLDYIQCRQKFEILDELDSNNKKIYELSQAQSENKEMTVLDLNKVKIEYSNIKGAKAQILAEEAEILASLSEIYGENCIDILKNMEYKFPEIYIPTNLDLMQVINSSPSFQSMMAEAESARKSKKISKMEALPSLSIGYKHQYEDGMHFNGAVLGISIPIFSSRGKQKAADAQIFEADYRAETTANSIETEINSLINKLNIIKLQIDEISPYVENIDYNSILVKAYEEGILSLLDYISERNYFTNAVVEFIALRHAAAKTQNGLNKYLQTYNF